MLYGLFLRKNKDWRKKTMSEQNSSMNGMDLGTGNSLEELFGSALPPVDLGDQIPASAQVMQPQPAPVGSQPAAAPEAQPQAIPQQVEQIQPQMQPPQTVPYLSLIHI